jgi:energy-coupling factor transporter ATP-binding protein EcfA2
MPFSEDEMTSASAEFHHLYEMLSTNQREIVDDFVDNSGTARQYAVMGEAGSGKTFLLKTLTSFLISRNLCFLFTTSTGIAATLLGGRKVHLAFSICQKGDNFLSNLRITNRQGVAMSNLEFLFFNEVSILNGRAFNLIDAKLRDLKQARFGSRRGDMPFGGVTVFITGTWVRSQLSFQGHRI